MSYALGAKATMLACSVGQVDHGIRQLNFLSESKLRFNRLHPFNQANMQQLHTAYFLSHCCWAAYWAYTNHDLALGCIGSLQMLPSYSLQPPLVYKCVRWFSPCNSKNQQCAGTPGVQYLTHTETLPYACMSSEECFPERPWHLISRLHYISAVWDQRRCSPVSGHDVASWELVCTIAMMIATSRLGQAVRESQSAGEARQAVDTAQAFECSDASSLHNSVINRRHQGSKIQVTVRQWTLQQTHTAHMPQ